MVDYKNAKIYKIYSSQTDKIYIGSTCKTLLNRFGKHKRDLNCNSKILFDNYDDCKIELIRNFPCNSKKELEREEGNIQLLHEKYIVNIGIAGRTKEEQNRKYYLKRKDSLKYINYHKKYREKNKEKFKIENKKYREKNREKLRIQNKKYREKNKEKLRIQSKKYNEKNREKIRIQKKKKYREKVKCEFCNGIVSKGNLKKHQKTLKCLKIQKNNK